METNFEIRTFDAEISEEEYRKLPKHNLYIILDNLRSAFNVGAIFRLCDTMRVSGLFLCGYTAFPPHIKLDKTSLGTIKYVPWKHFDTTKEAIDYAKKEHNVEVWAAETTSHSQNYSKLDVPPSGVALILGNEALGVEESLLEHCDKLIEIPTFGYKNSLNVATACSVLGYSILEKMGALHES
jgi:tRNA G18 (ribose-2'-O)-methylase SpoU